MNRKILGIALTLLAVGMLASPVMAIGPLNGEESSQNDNFVFLAGGLINTHGNADGSLCWAYVTASEHWVKWNWKAVDSNKGVINHAVAIIPAKAVGIAPADNIAFITLLSSYITEDYDNQWLFLSGDSGPYTYTFSSPSPYQVYGARGMLFWLNFFMFKSFGQSNANAFNNADPIADMYPTGELWMHNSIFTSSPT